MTQEEKELLVKDLCGRLQYGVKVDTFGMVNGLLGIEFEDIVLFGYDLNNYEQCVIEDVKPYLRPMSSMTEEERKIICSMNMLSDIELSDRINHQKMYVQNYTIETFDLFNKHHIDYRGLIEKGLALEAPKDMYKF